MPTPSDRLPRPTSLPQHERDTAGRAAELEVAREAYRYAHDKANIRGRAMTAELPREARPSPAYLAAVVDATLEVFANAAKVDGRPDAAARARLLEELRTGGIRAALTSVRISAIVIAGLPWCFASAWR